MATVVTVLRSGGDFRSWHVQAMQRQVRQWSPRGTEFVCLSDTPISGVHTIPLLFDWPGWWAKMELFRGDIQGDFLYTDLDNLVVGPLDDILQQETLTLQTGGWTALMWLPEDIRGCVWNKFIRAPERYIKRFDRLNVPVVHGVANYGDAGFIGKSGLGYAHWEAELPGQTPNIIELRRDTAMGSRHDKPIPEGTRILLCGQPHRPWTMTRFKKYYEENV